MKIYQNRFPWHLNWNLLRTFFVVVEHNGITKAANFLGLKQPTVSNSISQLEEVTAQKLIKRNAHHFSLTKSGERLYQEVSVIFGSVSQLPDILSTKTNEVQGHITLSFASHVLSSHLDDVIAKFAKEHPGVTFSIVVDESINVLASVQQNRISLGICLSYKEPVNVNCKILYHEFFAFYCGQAHPLFGQKNLSLKDLQGYDSVCFQTEVGDAPLQELIALRLKAKMNTPPRGISSNLNEVRRMILCSVGIGALPSHIANPSVEAGQLWQLPPYNKVPVINVYLIYNSKRRMNSAEKTLLNCITEMIEQTPIKEREYK